MRHVTFFVGQTWRFAVMLDPTVDVFISRDLDSAILPREVRFHILVTYQAKTKS